ncbi:MAG: hypothetical protein CMM87_02750 [Rickettsiales bacterium]|nr:hypothetical protein [Rickettsiales bacterium]|tara:strand:- start:8262 stop:8768 length:507 start_codon:yes stop_codon:yes gene_type:complete
MQHIDLNAWRQNFTLYTEQIRLQGMGQMKPTIDGDWVYVGPVQSRPLYQVEIDFQTNRSDPVLSMKKGDEINLTLSHSWYESGDDLKRDGNKVWTSRPWQQGSLRIVTADGEEIPGMQNPVQNWFETELAFSGARYKPRLKGLVQDLQLTWQPDLMQTKGRLVIMESR